METDDKLDSTPLTDGSKRSIGSGVDMDNSETEKLKERISCLSSKLKNVCCEVAFLVDRNERLESNVNTLAEVLKKNSISTIGEEGEELSIDQYIGRVKAGYLLSDAGGRRNLETTGLADGKADMSWLYETEDTDLTKTAIDDKGLSVQQMNDYETQIEILKTESEVLRVTLHEAYEREQHHKILIGQLDMAESRVNQKWGAFHNAVLQQWSNHCQFLQRQLAFVTMKLRQISVAECEQTKVDDESVPKADNVEYVAGVPTVYVDGLSDYEQQQQQQQQLPVTAMDNPDPAITNSTEFQAMMTGPPLMQTPPFPPPFVDDYLPTHQFMSGKMIVALQLRHYFTNMAMIEKAQREGRAYPQPQQLDEDLPDGVTVPQSHAPRRARAFGPGIGNEQEQMQPDSGTPFMWTPSAEPFVPDTDEGHV